MTTLETRWTHLVDTHHPLPEYPRPQLVRKDWINLNGLWDYAITPSRAAHPAEFEGKIVVPYPVESYLSGVQKPLLPDQQLWYRRTFNIPASWDGQHILLHFGAVDWRCEAWVNGQRAGSHQGGYLPFTFDITHFLRNGENDLVVAVEDPTHTELGECGKQVLKPGGIWYTAVSGIWQTVWLEPVSETSIERLCPTADIETGTLTVEVKLRGAVAGIRVFAAALVEDREVATAQGLPGEPIQLTISEPILWSPDNPFLYDLHLWVMQGESLLDDIRSYFAMRKFTLEPDPQGYLRFCINGKSLFLYGPLDQGYFPDGLYTSPTEEAMLFDLEYTRSIGCNMVRKHVKIEPSRWYYHCDRLGLIVWQDMPNGGVPLSELTAFLAIMIGLRRRDNSRLGRFGRDSSHNREDFQNDLKAMIDHLGFFTCIAVWVPFNEGWGQFFARQTAEWIKSYDPTRLVDHASGWFDQGGGDFKSTHVYFRKLYCPKPESGRAFVISEFGGYSLKLLGHLWNENKKFGYRNFASQEELTDAYISLLEHELKPLIPQGLAAAVYTQTTDVEIEINGFLTYDRELEKMDRERICKTHQWV